MTRASVAIAMGVMLIATTGCKKKPDEVEKLAQLQVIEATNPDTEASEQAALDSAVDELAANFQRVHFDLDSARLNQTSMDALEKNAKILQNHKNIRVEIQGHADNRGTTDYNLALGQRRAQRVQRYLTMLGIEPSRIPTVSFGEERPLVQGMSEDAWTQNRRAEFRITTGGGKVSGTVN